MRNAYTRDRAAALPRSLAPSLCLSRVRARTLRARGGIRYARVWVEV